MRSVRVIDDKIYTGCYREFGFWQRDSFGVLNYTSISKKLRLSLLEDEEIWKIVEYDQWIIFQSLQRMYIFDPVSESINTIDAENEIVNMFLVGSSVFYQERNLGLYKILNGIKTLVSDLGVLKTDEVVNVIGQETGLMIVTRNEGIHTLDDRGLQPWKEANLHLSSYSVYSCIQTSTKDFALGTISNGIIHLSSTGSLIAHFNQEKGLLNNTVLTIFEDQDNNFWAGLDNGISLINYESPLRVFRDFDGTLGSVYTTATHQGNLYIGTNQGLYCKPIAESTPFEFIKGTKGQVWSLRLIQGELFCGHHNGTFLISENRAKQIATVQGTWDFLALPNNDILQGNYNGLHILKKSGNNWQFSHKLEGFNNSSRHFVINESEVFINHEYKGVFHLEVDDAFTKVHSIKMDTILKSANSSITCFKNRLLYGYRDGILYYDPMSKQFEPDSALSEIYDSESFLSGSILSTTNEEFWVFTKDNITRVSFENLVNTPKIVTIPLTNEIRQEVTEFENIIKLSSDTYLVGTSYGYIKININQIDARDFQVKISSINNGINQDHSVSSNLVDKNESRNYGTDENNLSFNFHTSSYLSFYKPTYQYRLSGIYDKWSEWSTSSSVFFENLPSGKYEFNVRSKVGNQLSENIATYTFSIAKPWYGTNLMIAMYFLAVILFSIFMHNVYRSYYKRQQRNLIDRNQKELDLTRLQNEKEIMALKNEQLEKENKSKSNELAASTMSIIKKNELLNQIKEQLAKVGDTKIVRPVIKTIDQNLNQRKTWELFQEAFNNADRDFFKHLTEAHPDLSPNDLKLCAYLRLNLSSKEIAGLINISPRSVEVKRYRLRKKLGLDNNENLANYIINI